MTADEKIYKLLCEAGDAVAKARLAWDRMQSEGDPAADSQALFDEAYRARAALDELLDVETVAR